MPFYFHDSSTELTSSIGNFSSLPIDGLAPGVQAELGLPVPPPGNASKRGPKPRLLIVTAESRNAAGHDNVCTLASAFRSHYEIKVIVGFEGVLSDRLSKAGVDVVEVPGLGSAPTSALFASSVRKVNKTIREFRPALLHCHMAKSSLLVRSLAWMADVPVLYSPHGWLFSSGALVRKRARSWLVELVGSRATSHTVCPTSFDAKQAQRYLRLSEESISVIPNGLGRIDQQVRHISNRVELIMVADFERPNDHEMAIRMLSRLRPGSCRLRLVGTGRGLPSTVSLVSELGVGDYVRFLGDSDNIPELLANSDICLHFSAGSGVAPSVFEAMRAGVPVVATDSGGISEVVEDSTTGVLVSSHDDKSAALTIQRLVEDGDLRKKMGEVGREMFEECFSRAVMIERFAVAYAATRDLG